MVLVYLLIVYKVGLHHGAWILLLTRGSSSSLVLSNNMFCRNTRKSFHILHSGSHVYINAQGIGNIKCGRNITQEHIGFTYIVNILPGNRIYPQFPNLVVRAIGIIDGQGRRPTNSILNYIT